MKDQSIAVFLQTNKIQQWENFPKCIFSFSRFTQSNHVVHAVWCINHKALPQHLPHTKQIFTAALRYMTTLYSSPAWLPPPLFSLACWRRLAEAHRSPCPSGRLSLPSQCTSETVQGGEKRRNGSEATHSWYKFCGACTIIAAFDIKSLRSQFYIGELRILKGFYCAFEVLVLYWMFIIVITEI